MIKKIHPIDQMVGQRVRLARLSRGMSQTTLASALGLTFQQLQKYEKGTNRISASRLYQIAQTLEIDVESLFDDVPTGQKNKSGVRSIDAASITRVDLALVEKFSRIRSTRMKRHLLAIVSRLVEEPDTEASS